jgi:hypothetical protein
MAVAAVHPDTSDGRLLDVIFPKDVQSDNSVNSTVTGALTTDRPLRFYSAELERRSLRYILPLLKHCSFCYSLVVAIVTTTLIRRKDYVAVGMHAILCSANSYVWSVADQLKI